MDTKRMLTGMMLAMAVIFGYQFFIQWLYRHNNWKLPDQAAATSQVSPATNQSDAGLTPTSFPTTSFATGLSGIASTTQPAGLRVASGSTTQPTEIGSAAAGDPTYAMQVRILPQGAAIDGVTLNQYKLEQGKADPYSFEQPGDDTAEQRALASRSIVINGQTIDLSNANWNLTTVEAGSATYSLEVKNGDQTIARILKVYQLDKRADTKDQSEGYELRLTISIQNLTAAPLVVNTSFNGPLSPRPEIARGTDRSLLGGYETSGIIKLDHYPFEEFKGEHLSRDLTRSEKESLPLVWAGIGGTYFNAIIRPLSTSGNLQPSQYLKMVEAEAVHADEKREHAQARLTFTTADIKVDSGKSIDIPMKIFFGPKPRALLNNSYYSSPLIAYNSTLVMSSGICGYCAIDWLINLLVNMLRGFQWIFGGFAGHGDWGLAIIALVLVVRLILHPITKKSQINMLKMSKMGPEIERLKKKYGDDKEAMSKAQMELYKEMGMTPVLGCLPMFLQMPIFISLWQALQSTFELRQAPFLWNFTWIHDLAQPDRLIAFSHSFPLPFGWHIDAINILPVLVAVVSFLNMKYTPRPPAATPEAEQQQKMMQWMTLVFPLMFYGMPSGLNIYYLTSTSLGIWEGKRIRAHIKQHEEAEKAGRVFVDASPGRRNRQSNLEAPSKPQGKLAGWLARLQEKAQQMQDGSDKSNRKK